MHPNKYQKIKQFVYEEIIYNSHLQSLNGTSIVALSWLFVIESLRLTIPILIYFLFQAFYLYDRYTHKDTDRVTNPQRSNHIERYKDKFGYLILINASIAVFGLILFASNTLLIVAIVVLCFGFAYPHYAKNITKAVPLFKNFYVAGVQALLVYFPVLQTSIPPKYSSLALLLGFVFFEAFIAQLTLDIKDARSDSSLGLKTAPVLFGVARTNTIVQVLSVVVGLVFGYLYWVNGNHTLSVVAIGSLPINIWAIAQAMAMHKRGYIYMSAKFIFLLLLASMLARFIV